MKFFHSQKKKELENIILNKGSQAQKAKNHMFSSYSDYSPDTNAVILLNMYHTLRGDHTQEE
jgi:hypothetical protein